MTLITDYEIRLSVDAAGNPLNGFVNYKLAGSASFAHTAVLSTADLTVLAAVITGDNVYFDAGTNDFVRKK